MSQVLDALGLLDFTMLWPVIAWWAFISLIFQFFSGRGDLQITETTVTQSADTGAHLYLCTPQLKQCAN
jgi:hypothetical protein